MPTRRSAAAPPAVVVELRQRILDTSESLLETEGLSALSMREVARRAGVTHQAPYHHFADRESILAELVTQGFDELGRRLGRANDRAAPDDRERLGNESGQAYVGYSIDHPGVFRIMFRPELCDLSRFPAARESGARARAELDRLVTLLYGAAAAHGLALTYWAQVHGLACLLVDGPLGQALPGLRERRACMRETLAHFVRAMVAEPVPRRNALKQGPSKSL